MVKEIKVIDDFVFRSIFGKQENSDILKSFIQEVLNIKIKSLTVLENAKLQQETSNDKLGILDIKAILHDGTKINIEMQLADKHDIIERTLFYWSKLYIEGFNVR